MKEIRTPQMTPVQIDEMKRCFFAGAFALLTRLMTFTDPGRKVTRNDMQMITEINLELKEFFQKIVQEADFARNPKSNG